tara:strand:- start:259 stop:480 length:222 start_codon:yes stop_codon:yes gene_type:complete
MEETNHLTNANFDEMGGESMGMGMGIGMGMSGMTDSAASVFSNNNMHLFDSQVCLRIIILMSGISLPEDYSIG